MAKESASDPMEVERAKADAAAAAKKQATTASPNEPGDSSKDAANTKDGKKQEEEDELDEKDRELKNELEMLVQRLKESNTGLYTPALDQLRTLIRTATSSMTAVPKPLKFLGPHFPAMVEIYEKWSDKITAKKQLADILSVLAMSYGKVDERQSLHFRLVGTQEDAGQWGHEYVRHLSSELMSEYAYVLESEGDTSVVVDQALKVIPFFMKHNAEADAVDLLLDLELLEKLPDFVDKETYTRVGLYLLSTVQYLAPPDDIVALKAAHQIYLNQTEWTMALQVALRLRDNDLIIADFTNCPDVDIKKQLAFILARQQIFIDLDDIPNNGGGAAGELTDDDKQSIQDILRNTKLSEYFLKLGKDLDVLEPKTPDDIYKLYLENSRDDIGGNYDSARKNLASTFVNAFVNAGFAKDKLMLTEGSDWVFRNKEHGMLSTVASLGALHLWDVDNGLSSIDKYQYAEQKYVRAGALLAIGLVNTGVRNEADPALALLTESLDPSQKLSYVASIIGLGMSYIGSSKREVVDLLLPIVSNEDESIDVVALAALSLGLVFVGNPDGDIIETIVSVLMTDRKDSDFKSPYMMFMGLGLALMFLGKQEQVDSTIAAVEVLDNSFKQTLKVLLDVCAYAGTGNVLKIQTMLHHCSEHVSNDESKQESSDDSAESASGSDAANAAENADEEAEAMATDAPAEGEGETAPKKEEAASTEDATTVSDNSFQGIATLGIALIAMGEDIGAEMALRSFDHLMHYGEPVIRRAVPLALGLLCCSNPLVNILDVLSKYSHDNDPDVSRNAIFAMGLVGAGTNNARLAQMLRQLATYYSRINKHLFIVRIAQGLVHLGKGTMTLNPFHSNRFLMSNPAVAGLLVNLVAFVGSENVILGSAHYLLYYLLVSAHPRHLMTFNPDLTPLETTVRVGQAVDVVGQAGRPKTITGFQTHNTPVLLAYTERAELATEEYISLSSILDGFVVLKKNPDC